MSQNNSVRVRDVLEINERVFTICDAWPLRKTYKKFVVYMSYLTVHLLLMNMDLYDAFGDLEHMVENIIDNAVATTTYFMLFLLRFSRLLERVIATVKQEIADNKFENLDEKRLYFAYHKISDKFGRYTVPGVTMIAVLWYLTPMLHALKSESGRANGSSNDFALPFRIHTFLDYEDDFRNFTIMYLYQFPLMFIALCHISSMSLIISLVLHVCGKFAILSYRIQHIPTKSGINLNGKIREFVIGHLKLILMANYTNSALQIILLIELVQTSIRMAVLVYMMLLNPGGSVMSTFVYALYISVVTSMLYLYSFIGERLAYESSRVAEAYYDIDWQDLSVPDQKLLLLAMSSGRQTLHVSAGKFYTFSLYGFIDLFLRKSTNLTRVKTQQSVTTLKFIGQSFAVTDLNRIMKTTFGYVSLLRALM